VSSLPYRGLTHLGMDVHKDSISIGILAPEDDSPEVERIFHDEASVRRFVARSNPSTRARHRSAR
jgi:hypothetical protein